MSAIIAVAGVDAQDLLAEQAPLDKQMNMVDSIALRRLLLNEAAAFPSQELFPEWDNSKVRFTTQLPDSFQIELTGFTMPTPSTKITDIFGYRPRRRRVHNGIDLKVQKGDTIYAAFDGKVRMSTYQRRGYGHYVVIRHENGLETVYGHLSKRIVAENQNVRSGDPIGLGGNTGRSTGSHLHFETVFVGTPIDPKLLFDFENQDVTGDFYVYRKSAPRKGKTSTGAVLASDDEQPLYHKVRSGENLSIIANKRKVSLNTLYKLNKLNARSVLRPGQSIRYN